MLAGEIRSKVDQVRGALVGAGVPAIGGYLLH
jgi:hypothetical protein